MLPWQPLFLALANRARGGLVQLPSGQLGRLLCWALPFALCLATSAWPPENRIIYAIELIAAAYAGSTIPAWGKNFHLQAVSDWLMMTLWGFIMIAPPALILSAYGFYHLAVMIAIGSFFIAPSYWLGKQVKSSTPGFETGPPLGELFFGAVLGVFVFCSQL